MNVLFVDDERSAHTNFFYDTKDFKGIRHIEFCFDYDKAVDYAKLNHVDCAFLDVELPGKNGLMLANELRVLRPEIEIVFITGYDEYAREAYRAGGRAYLTKPYEKEDLERVMKLMERLAHPVANNETFPYGERRHIFARTFGNFDFLVEGVPLNFRNAKAKELLAYLIHQMGGTVTNAQVFFALWEKQEYNASTSTYVRRTLRALKEELEAVGVGDILIAQRNNIRVDGRRIICDTYALLNGNVTAARVFNGMYMSQYYWGEETIPLLSRTATQLLKK